MDAVAAERNVGAEDAAGDGGAAEAEFAAVLDAIIVGVVEEGDAGAVIAEAATPERRSLIDVVFGVGLGGVGAEAVVCGIEIEGVRPGGRGGVHVFFFNDTAATEISTLSLHDALPILDAVAAERNVGAEDAAGDGGAAEAEFAAVLDAVIVGVVEEGDAGAV